MYNKLNIETTPLWFSKIPEGSTPRDENGIYTFAEKYNQFYLDDVEPFVEPELGVWSTQKPQLTEIGGIFPMTRGLLVSQKTLKILSDFKVAPYKLYSIPYEIRYMSNPQWDEFGNYYFLFFYTSGFNFIDWKSSYFYQHAYTEKSIVLKDNLQFNNAEDFVQEFKRLIFNEGLCLSPKNIRLLPSFEKYDLFGIYLYERNLIISQNLTEFCKKKKIFTRYNKAVDLDYKIDWLDA